MPSGFITTAGGEHQQRERDQHQEDEILELRSPHAGRKRSDAR
jgi:hypothetical protein